MRLFYTFQNELATFRPIRVEEMPPVPRRLLAHDEHMTITLESIHGSAVDVHVLASYTVDNTYSRKIYLTRQEDDAPVLFGIIRMNLSLLDDAVRREIESQRVPLGRVLIRHNVLRKVELMQLFKVEPADELQRILQSDAPLYGRTAWIHLNDQPAVELLEIVPAAIRPVGQESAKGGRKKERPGLTPKVSVPFQTLPERLKDWCEETHAAEQIGICLGLMTEEESRRLNPHDSFWTENPLAIMLLGILDQLIIAKVIHTRELDDGSDVVRWNKQFVGSWKQSS